MFSDKKVTYGACAPNLTLFYQKKSYSPRFCIGQLPSSAASERWNDYLGHNGIVLCTKRTKKSKFSLSRKTHIMCVSGIILKTLKNLHLPPPDQVNPEKCSLCAFLGIFWQIPKKTHPPHLNLYGVMELLRKFEKLFLE